MPAPLTSTYLALPLIVPGTRTVVVSGVQLGRVLRRIAVGPLGRVVPRKRGVSVIIVPRVRGGDKVHRGTLRSVLAVVERTAARFARSSLGAHTHAGIQHNHN